MRRVFALAAVLSLAIPTLASAQAVVGFGVGLRSASMSIEEPGSDPLPDSRTGFSIGGFVSIPVSEVFSIQPGLTYGQKGGSETQGSSTATLELDYLEVPILGVFHIPSEGSAAVHLFAGPTISFEVGCDIGGEGPDVESATCEEEEIDTKSTDLGAALGAAVSFSLNETASLFVAGFYNLGITDILDDSADNTSAKTRAFGANVGLAFAVGG